MSTQNLIGKKGEDIAKEYLLAKGYEIVESNWRYGRAEIDLIIREASLLVFVEVKTRSSLKFGTPESFINRKKERHIADAAAAYMRRVQHIREFRFDVISVLLTGRGKSKIKHIKDAFFPGLNR